MKKFFIFGQTEVAYKDLLAKTNERHIYDRCKQGGAFC